MHRKSLYLTLLGLVTTWITAQAQQAVDVSPEQPVLMNGMEYGYTIRNEGSKEVGSKGTFGRYEVTLYATNRSGCSKIMMPRQTSAGVEYQELLADFTCLNATGRRMTPKGGSLRAKEFYVPYTTSTKGPDGKTVTTSTQVRIGNIVRNGESVTTNVIFMVPKDERPVVRVRTQSVSDL